MNLAVVANAGSGGELPAISNRLAAMALSPSGGPDAREDRGRDLHEKGRHPDRPARSKQGTHPADVGLGRVGDVDALARLDRVFFGTIHSFCLLLARRHGSAMGIHLNPTLVEEDDQSHWQEFLRSRTR